MPKRRVTTAAQRAAARRNLEKARAARRRGLHRRADAAYKRAANARNVGSRRKSVNKGMFFEKAAAGLVKPTGKAKRIGSATPRKRTNSRPTRRTRSKPKVGSTTVLGTKVTRATGVRFGAAFHDQLTSRALKKDLGTRRRRG